MSDIVVAYYSRTGKTRQLARELAEMLGADAEEIIDHKNRSGPIGFVVACRDAATRRSTELDSHHTLQGHKVLVIAMPVWAFAIPPAIRAYVAQVDLAGVKVCALCTYDGSGEEKAFASLAELIPGGLAQTLALKKSKPGEPELTARLKEWAEAIRRL
jgi:flavodoxin